MPFCLELRALFPRLATAVALTFAAVTTMQAQPGAPATPATPAPRAAARPTAEQIAQLKSGPTLPYTADPAWPQLPKEYTLGACSGVDLDKQGHVWIFNRGAWPVMEFDRAGKLLQAWSAEKFKVISAHGIRVGPDDNLWCVDVNGHVIFKMSREGKKLFMVGKTQGTPGDNNATDAFQRPTNVAFKAGGNVYISDGYLNTRVVEISPEGKYVKQWGTAGKGNGQFNIVHDMAIDPAGRVYVADRANERIQIFDPEGKYLAQWTNVGAPWGITYSARDNAIFMCDGKYARMLKFNLEGEVLGAMSTYGKGPGQLDQPHSIVVDQSDGSIYTADVGTARVQKWIRK